MRTLLRMIQMSHQLNQEIRDDLAVTMNFSEAVTTLESILQVQATMLATYTTKTQWLMFLGIRRTMKTRSDQSQVRRSKTLLRNTSRTTYSQQ